MYDFNVKSLDGDKNFLSVEDEGDDEPGRDSPDGLDEPDPVRVHSAEGEVEGKHFVSCLVPKVQQNRIHS
jgi:hypothetical protein